MPWTGGVQPVENEVQATGVTIGALERRVPKAERRQSAARVGNQPRSNPGASTAIVPPSRPRNMTRETGAGMVDCLGKAGQADLGGPTSPGRTLPPRSIRVNPDFSVKRPGRLRRREGLYRLCPRPRPDV